MTQAHRQRESVRIAVLGTGAMGSGILRLLLEKSGLELVGVYARRPERAGTDAGEAIGMDERLGIAIESELPALLDRVRPDVAIQATCSRLSDAEAELEACLTRGVNVVSIAEEMAWPAASSPERAARLDRLAREHGASAIGAGVNPGFVLDLLVATLTGACARVDAITATRVNDLAPYGPTVLRSQGVGMTPEAFARGLRDGKIVGHIGFPESIGMLAAALGWRIEGIEQTREPIVSKVLRETPHVRVEPGCVAGCSHTAVAYRGGCPVITLVHPQQVYPQSEGVETGDVIEIDGAPPLRIASRPEIPGGQATVALAVNTLPRVVAAAPGLHSMLDLPVPTVLPGRDDVPEEWRGHA
jgi:4-hydroxy-tetrahydrodipicolinate reductase